MHSNKIAVFMILLVLASCGTDLVPSAEDKRLPAQCGTTGPNICQKAPDFTVSDTLGNTVTLSAVVPAHTGVVLYFTMWCPTCDSQMTFIQDNLIPLYHDVVFYAVDYVSGTVAEARNAEVSNGYAGSGFIVLADTGHTILNEYGGTMGTTVVIDRNGIIQMNEDFKNGSKLQSVLSSLP